MSLVVVKNSVITGVHRTKVGSHKTVALIVEADNSIPHIDPECMKVCFYRSSGLEPDERDHLSKKPRAQTIQRPACGRCSW